MLKSKTSNRTNMGLGCKTKCKCRCHDNVKIAQQNFEEKRVKKLGDRVNSVFASSSTADKSSDGFINILKYLKINVEKWGRRWQRIAREEKR